MKFFLAVLVLLGGHLTLTAQTAVLQPGYDYLINNETVAARDFFAAQLQGPAAAEAALGLSYSEAMLLSNDKAEDAFLQYTALDKNVERRNATIDALWSPVRKELSKAKYAWMEEQAENPYTRLRPLALYTLGEHEFLVDNLKKSRAYHAAVGGVSPWQTVGPFENISESGFDRDFGVLGHPQAGSTFTNKLGVPTRWVPGVQPNRQGWLNFSTGMVTRNTIAYAQTFCTADRAQEVVFRLGTSGSVKVWVNDELVFSEFHERDNHLDTYVFAAALKQGANRLLVQIGTTEGRGSNFMLRITDADGTLVPGLAFTDTYQAYRKGSDWTPRVYPNPTEAYYTERIASGSANYLDYLSLIQFYNVNGFIEASRSVVDRARVRYPNNYHLQSELIGVLRQLDDETRASELEQELVQLAPNHHASLRKRLSDAQSLKDWPAYERLLTAYKQEYGASEATLMMEVLLAGGREENEKVMDLVNRGLKLYPNSTDLLTGKARLEAQVRKRPREAVALLEKYLKHHYRDKIVEALIDLHFQAGETAEVVELFDKLIEREPTTVNYYSRLSRLYYLLGNYRKSQATLDEALALAPYLGSLHSSLAGIYAEAGDKNKASTAYAKAIELNPYDYDSRDALRNLHSEATSAFSVLPETDYYALYANSKGTEAYPDDNSAILAYDVEQIVHPGGASETRTTVLIKALNSEGVDKWKEYDIPIYNQQKGVVEKVEVLDPDGSRHEATRSGTNVVFDRLQAGGAIYLVYRIQDYKFGRLSGKFWNDHPLSMALPSQQSTYSLLVPSGTQFSSKITGMQHTELAPQKSTVDGRDLYVWQLRDQAGIRPEAVTPNYSDILTTVRVSNIEDWSYIAQWYSELTYAKIRVDDEVRHAVDQLFADAPAELTERQQVERIYAFVAGNIRYISIPFLQSNYIPQSAARTLATRQGDCKDVSALFVAMCDARNIRANLVLVNTRNRGRMDLSLPGTGFNHCIARIDLDGTQYYVELTDENLPFGTGDWSVNGAFGLTIPRRGEAFDGTAGPINPPSRGVNSVIRKGEVTFDGGDMVFTLESKKTNSVASGMRGTYKNESTDNRVRAMQEAVSGDYPRVELTDLQFDAGLEDLSRNEVGYAYAFRVADPSSTIGGMKIYPLILTDQLETPAYVTTASRTLPIDLWETFRAEYYEQTLDIITPQGKSLVELPASVEISNDYVDYAIEYSATERGLRLKRSIRLKKELVPPTEYAPFRDDILRIVEADKVNLAYK